MWERPGSPVESEDCQLNAASTEPQQSNEEHTPWCTWLFRCGPGTTVDLETFTLFLACSYRRRRMVADLFVRDIRVSKISIAEDENESSRGISKTNQYSSSIDRTRRERLEDERPTTPVRSITPPITIRAIDASNMKDGGITRISKRPCANILLRFPCPSAMGSDLAEVIIQRRPGRRSNHRSSSRDETSTG